MHSLPQHNDDKRSLQDNETRKGKLLHLSLTIMNLQQDVNMRTRLHAKKKKLQSSCIHKDKLEAQSSDFYLSTSH